MLGVFIGLAIAALLWGGIELALYIRKRRQDANAIESHYRDICRDCTMPGAWSPKTNEQ